MSRLHRCVIPNPGRGYRTLIGLALLLTSGAMTVGCSIEHQTFGKPVSENEVLSLEQVLKEPESILEKEIVIEAEITQVCQTAGCWCILQQGPHQLYVSMNTFTIPSDLAGTRCRVEGRLTNRNDRLTLVATGMELLADFYIFGNGYKWPLAFIFDGQYRISGTISPAAF